MKVACPSCNANLNIDDKKIPAGGARIKCPTCQQVFPVKQAVGASSGPVPLPGLSVQKPAAPSWDDAATRVVRTEMIPGALTDAAPPSNVNVIPLPGQSTPGQVTTMKVALPGKSAPAQQAPIRASAVPLPGLSAAKPNQAQRNDEKTQVGSPTGEPAPTYDFDPAAAIGLPGNYEQTRVGGAPVPSPSLGGDVDFADDADVGFIDSGPTAAYPSVERAAESRRTVSSLPVEQQSAIPLPGGYAPTSPYPAQAPSDDAFSFDEPAPTHALSDPTLDFSDLPSPKGATPHQPAPDPFAAESFEVPSFDDTPPPRQVSQAPSFDFGDLPSPRGGGPTRAERSPAHPPPQDTHLPSASADPFESTDFSVDLPMPSTPDLPSPAQPQADDFSFDMAPPPPVNRAASAMAGAPQAAPSFGEVEFETGGESLEFDPTSTAQPLDDLEADLSAPPISAKPAGSADGLEMLSFIDQTARDAGAKEGQSKARRFHIRRRSGKVFGPFEDAVIIKMLEDGQLLGNEEVSVDSQSWQPIGGEPTFQAAITQLMESPSKSTTSTSLKPIEASQQQQLASMDRLKNLYEGRMAAVAVVQGRDAVPFRKMLPFIIAGVLLLAIGGAGAFWGTTPYGVFGLKVLFPAKVKAGTREFVELRAAQKALLSDTFKGYQQARDTAQSTLRVKEYPEARAIWCQSIFYLQRKYAAATPAELQQAQAELQNIALLGAKHPEVVKARAGIALTQKDADAALALLSDAIARSENSDDVELTFLRAEAFVQKNQPTAARGELEGILKKSPDSARVLHALGNLHQMQKEADLAAARYEQALKADPDHASSAVELAAIELLIRKDITKGALAIDQAIVQTRRDKLGPAELGKALALKAEALAMQHKTEEAIPMFGEALKADPGNSFTKARLAAAYVALNDHEKALPFFKAAAEASPESLEYAEAYLSSLIVLGKMEDATRVVAGSSARFPANARLTYLSARVDDALDRSKQAEAAYLKAAAADPTLVDAHLYLARLYLRFRRINEAKPQLEEALRKAPDNAEVRVVMGELALSDNDPERAENELKRAIELNPTLSEAYVGISKLELSKGAADRALEQIEKALTINPHVFGGRVQRGRALWKLGRLEEAVKELEAARLDEPRNINITVTLGAVQLEKKDLGGATGSLMSAITSEPSNPEANFYLAKVKNLKAEHTGAIEHMKKALDLQPKRAEYRYWMGRIYLDAKKSPEAIDEWKVALELNPRYTDALEALGYLFLDRNEVKKAVSYFERALETDSNRTAVQAAIGDAYSQAEEWAQAISTYEKALQADPDLKAVYFKLGQAYGEVKKFDQAILYYKKATALEPDNANVWLSLGYAYKERKQKSEAAAAFGRYLARRPDAENKKEIEDEIDYLKKREGE